VEGARSARLSAAYQADLIMNSLEKLHPRFYSRPTTQHLRDGKPFRIEDIKEGFLTKQELLKSYRDAQIMRIWSWQISATQKGGNPRGFAVISMIKPLRALIPSIKVQ
jgi:hypothetical protein